MSAKARSFPIPFDDETIFSLASRFHVIYGMGKTKSTLQLLFKSPAVMLRTGLPGRLSNLATALPDGFPLSIGELIERHTAYPYYAPFLPLPRRVAIWNAMRTNGAGSIKGLLGALASRHGAKDQLRYCPRCVREDFESKGQPYWHRTHQLPGVLVCPKHSVGLHQRRDEPTNPMRFDLFLPPLKSDTENYLPCRPNKTQDQDETLGQIAHASSNLLTIDQGTFTTDELKTLYHRKTVALGLTGPTSQSAPKGLVQLLTSRLGYLAELDEYAFLGANRIESWARDILRVDRATSHPLSHIVLITALFGDVRIAISELRQEKIPEQGAVGHSEIASPTPISSQSAPRAQQNTPPWHESLRELLLEKQLSMTAAAKLLGTTTTTVRLHAQRMGIAVSLRPKRITPELETTILDALRFGPPRSQVAQRHRVSLSTVSRLLATHANVRESFLKSQRLMRQALAHGRLVSLLARNPTFGPKQIRANIPSDYTWLYRNDRQWLEQELKPRVMQKAMHGRRSGRKDEENDRLYVQQLQEAADQLLSQDRKPTRITRSLLGRMTGLTAMIEKKLDRFPRTKACLPTLCESKTQFKQRRLRWAAETLNKQGKDMTMWRLRRLAGLGPRELAEIELALERMTSRND